MPGRRRRGSRTAGVLDLHWARGPLLVFEVGVHHHLDQLLEPDLGIPAELPVSLGGVAAQDGDVSRPEETLVLDDVGTPVIDAGMTEGNLQEIMDGIALAGSDDVVVRFVLLKHEPHGANVVTGEAPVTTNLHVAQGQYLLASQCDPCYRPGDLARQKLESAARGFMVEQDARASPCVVGLAVILGDVVTEDLCRAVRRAGMKLGRLPLGRFVSGAEHLRARRLVETDAVHRSLGVDPNRLEHTQDAHSSDVASQLGLFEGKPDEADRAEIVDLIGLRRLQYSDKAGQVAEVSLQEPDRRNHLLDGRDFGIGLPTYHPENLVLLRSKKFRQVETVLSSYSGNQGARHRRQLLFM